MPKFDLKVQDPAKITLFANKAEAIVFWLSVAGLIFLAIVSLFRYLSNRRAELDESIRKELLMRIERLEDQNERLNSRMDSLQTQLQSLDLQ